MKSTKKTTKLPGKPVKVKKPGKPGKLQLYKQIYAICNDCAGQLYDFNKLDKNAFIGITCHQGKCSICNKDSMLTPLRDFWVAQGHWEMWD